MRWKSRMFYTKARSHEGGRLVVPGTCVALGKRVLCVATFVDIVSVIRLIFPLYLSIKVGCR